jgi:hypothetical protein
VIIAKNCTYSVLYWFYHLENWPPQIVVGSLTYSKEEALAILQASNPGSAGSLFSQLHGAILNYLAGADFEAVKQTAIDASSWLNNHPEGVEISEEDRQTALALERALEDYNKGVTGPGRCPDEPVVPALAPTSAPTLTDTPNPTITGTNTPVSTRPKPTPTDTRRPRPAKPTSEPPPQPTETPPPPPPTDPPQPPTKEPPPTPVPTSG